MHSVDSWAVVARSAPGRPVARMALAVSTYSGPTADVLPVVHAVMLLSVVPVLHDSTTYRGSARETRAGRGSTKCTHALSATEPGGRGCSKSLPDSRLQTPNAAAAELNGRPPVARRISNEDTCAVPDGSTSWTNITCEVSGTDGRGL